MQRRPQRRMGVSAARTRWIVALGVACAGLFAALLTSDVLSPPASRPVQSVAGATTAANLFVSPTGSDENSCTQAAPCQTFDRAYSVAAGGQVVEVAAGTYPEQRLRSTGRKTKAVVFRPAAGAQVVLSGQLLVGVSNVAFSDMRVNTFATLGEGLRDLSFSRIDTPSFWVNGKNLRILDSDIGPADDAYAAVSGEDVVVEGNTFHDFRLVTPGVHMECLHVRAADRMLIRGNRFIRCAVMDLFITRWGKSPERTENITVENNFFGAPTPGYYAILSGAAKNLVIRHNSSLADFYIDGGVSWGPGPTKIIANVGPKPRWGCDRTGKVKYRRNVWNGVTCSATDLKAPLGFVDPANLDLHLRAGAAAVDRGDPENAPSTDIDGQARSRRPDAGADELG